MKLDNYRYFQLSSRVEILFFNGRIDTLFLLLFHFLLLLLFLLIVIVPIYHHFVISTLDRYIDHGSLPSSPIKFNQIVTLVEEGTRTGRGFTHILELSPVLIRTMIRINIRTFLVHNVPSLWLMASIPGTTDIVVFKLGGNKLSCRKGNSVGNFFYSGKITPVMGMEMRLLRLNLFI